MKWPAKEESEVRPYGVNWSARLGSDTILTSVFAVVAGSVVIDSQTFSGVESSCVLSRGVNGECAELTCTITTAGGFTYEVALTLPVKAADDLSNQASTNTKGQIVEMAYEAIGIPGFMFEASAEEMASGIRRLDSLMSEWSRLNIDLGYSFPAAMGQSDPSDDSGIPDYAVDAVMYELAKRIAPSKGKSLSVEAKSAAAASKRALVSMCSTVPEMQFPRNTPRGAGNRWRARPFFTPVTASDCC